MTAKPPFPEKLDLLDINWHGRPGSAAPYQNQIDVWWDKEIKPFFDLVSGVSSTERGPVKSQPSKRDELAIEHSLKPLDRDVMAEAKSMDHVTTRVQTIERAAFKAGWDACQEHSRQVDEDKLFNEMCSMASKNQGVGEKNAAYKNGWWDCWEYVKRSLRGE